MTERAYTVRELDALRQAVRDRVIGRPRVRRNPDHARDAIIIEEQVRTHMLAGHVAADLVAADEEIRAALLGTANRE